MLPYVWFEGDNQQQRPGVLCDSAVGLCHAHGEREHMWMTSILLQITEGETALPPEVMRASSSCPLRLCVSI